ncbi:Aft1 HRA domain-containing protein [Dactylonectria estremocensis]|uniref:Aft1 HRA domain-containing protein n=1 Tax=Dactylonectria estremocensis TaxID=1079267 RepID=A0A9P9D7B8_9HYPO|nr:Aft1 HRA domain-containing protein [Dactylonectria estremocensis]
MPDTQSLSNHAGRTPRSQARTIRRWRSHPCPRGFWPAPATVCVRDPTGSDIINKDGEGFAFAARRVTTAVVTQLFSYMVGKGVFGDTHLRGGFPTPNESSLRSGLTPGGSGSMFPAPSPNSQALFAQLASGGATPSTIDFHRTAISAAAKREQANGVQRAAGQPPQPPTQ